MGEKTSRKGFAFTMLGTVKRTTGPVFLTVCHSIDAVTLIRLQITTHPTHTHRTTQKSYQRNAICEIKDTSKDTALLRAV